MLNDELKEHLNALQREDCYRVDEVLKESPFETTQRVMFVGVNGAEQGPFIRKYIDCESGLGSAYERIFQAQKEGARFRCVPRIFECYNTGEHLVAVMECVPGETLDEVLRRCGPSYSLAADVFARLCDALIELHEGFDPPIIHRDIKPSNIMLSRNALTIIDFGIARSFKEAVADDTCHFGTRSYAPPEQFGFGQTTVRSDIYALGMVLYLCFTGEVPDVQVRERLADDCRIPEFAKGVILRATEFDPQRRFASVREMKFVFEQAAVSQGGMLGVAQGACAPIVQASVPFCEDSFGVAAGSLAESASRTGGISLFKRLFASDWFEPRGFFACRSARAGRMWNVLVASWTMLLLAGACMATFLPNEADAHLPLWFLVLQYLVIVGSNVVLLGFAMCDKRRMYERHPRLPRYSAAKQTLVVMAYFLVSFLLLGLIAPSAGA